MVALLHRAHGAVARILVRVAAHHVVQQALAHRAFGPAHLLDLQLREDLGEDGHATGEHRAPVLGDAFQRNGRDAARAISAPR